MNETTKLVAPSGVGVDAVVSCIPPIGLMSRWRWLELHGHHKEEERYREIMAAIDRYEEVGKDVPAKWRYEAEDLLAMYS